MWRRSKVFSLSLRTSLEDSKAATGGRSLRSPKLQIEKLEDRQMMTASPGGLPLPLNATPTFSESNEPVAIGESFGLTEEFLAQFDAQNPAETIAIDIPAASADGSVRIAIQVGGETQTLVLEPSFSTRSSAFQVLVQGDDGELSEFQFGAERVYTGFVEERPGIQISAVISERGLTAEAIQLNGEFVWEISPQDVLNEAGVPLHSVNSTNVLALLDFNHDHDGDGIADHAAGEHVDNEPGGGHGPGCACADCVAAFSSTDASEAPVVGFAPVTSFAAAAQQEEETPPVAAATTINQTLIDPSTQNDLEAFRNGPDPSDITVPGSLASRQQRAVLFNPIQTREAVIGFDVTNESFREAYNSNVQAVLDNIALFLNGNERVGSSTTSPSTLFLRDAAIRQVAGTIIIRTSLSQDPYADANGDANINRSLLDDFQDRWNSNADAANVGLTRAGDVNRTQSNHDFATLLGGGGTDEGIDGLAFVGQVGQSFRYSISDGSGAAFWRAVARHEIGHTWGLPHSFGRFESDPGGNGIGIMAPTGLRNRLSTDEIIRITEEANEASSSLEVIDSPGNLPGLPAGTFTEFNVRPHATRDDVQVFSSAPVTIDVLANDYDVNNDPLFIERFDSVSEAGGTISVSIGTGDQGQDELIYTPPAGFSGEDLFFYTIGDVAQFGEGSFGADFQQFGIVSIFVDSPEVVLDESETEFFFDFGPSDQVVFSNQNVNGIGISPASFGDVFFTRNGQQIGEDEIGAFDRGVLPNINNVNRDAIVSTEPITVNFVVPNGRYDIAVNLADPNETRDNQRVSAEGEVIFADVDSPVGTNQTQSFTGIDVIDGVLELTIEDLGGESSEFALNRVSLTRTAVFTPPVLFGDFNQDNSVDVADFVFARDVIGQSVATPFEGSDHDGNSVVGVGDIKILQANFGLAQVVTTIVGAELNNGSFTSLTPFTGETGSNLAIGRVLSTANNTISIPGWVIRRVAIQGGNSAFGLDGLAPLGSNGNDAPVDPVVFTNNDVIAAETSSAVAFDFTSGDTVSLSFDLGTDHGLFSNPVDLDAVGQATLVFDAGTPNEFTQAFPTRRVTATQQQQRFTETFTLDQTFSTVSIQFTVGELRTDGPGVQRTLLDDVQLDVSRLGSTAASLASLSSPLASLPTLPALAPAATEPVAQPAAPPLAPAPPASAALTAEDVPSFDAGVIVVNGPLRGATLSSTATPTDSSAELTELDLLALTLAEETFGEIGEEALFDTNDESHSEEDSPIASLDSALEQLESGV